MKEMDDMAHSGTITQKVACVSKVLTEASELDIEVVVTAPDRRRIPNCHFALDPRDSTRIELLVPAKHDLVSDIPIDCRFTTIEKSYHFSSRVTAQTGNGKNHLKYRIVIPEAITYHNRRSCPRVYPSGDQPVWLRCHHDRKGEVRIPVENISTGGVCLIVPQALPADAIRDPFSCVLCLPDGSQIQTNLSPCNQRKLFGVVKIGAQFGTMDETDRHRIVDYIDDRQAGRELQRGETAHLDARLAVIAHPDHRDLEAALKDRYRINRAWQATNIAKLQAYLPDLIVLDMDHPDAMACLNGIKDHPALRSRPLVILGKMHRGIRSFGAGIRYLSQPVHAHHLRQAIDQLLREYRIAQRIANKPLHYWQTTRIALICLAGSEDESIANHLRQNNCRVTIIEGQKRLMPQLIQSDPACILLDTDDAEMAETICRLICFNKGLKQTAKILLTGNRNVGLQFATKNQVCGFLEKPISHEILISAIHRVIEEEMHSIDSAVP